MLQFSKGEYKRICVDIENAILFDCCEKFLTIQVCGELCHRYSRKYRETCEMRNFCLLNNMFGSIYIPIGVTKNKINIVMYFAELVHVINYFQKHYHHVTY